VLTTHFNSPFVTGFAVVAFQNHRAVLRLYRLLIALNPLFQITTGKHFLSSPSGTARMVGRRLSSGGLRQHLHQRQRRRWQYQAA
jgi:hypothetical protein